MSRRRTAAGGGRSATRAGTGTGQAGHTERSPFSAHERRTTSDRELEKLRRMPSLNDETPDTDVELDRDDELEKLMEESERDELADEADLIADLGLSQEEMAALSEATAELSEDEGRDFEHEYQLHEATGERPGDEGGNPDRVLEINPRDQPPRDETSSVDAEDLGERFLEGAAQDARFTEEHDTIPNETERIRPGPRRTADLTPGNPVQVTGLLVDVPDPSEHEAEISEKAERIAQRSRAAAQHGNVSDAEIEEDPDEPLSRAVMWRAAHERTVAEPARQRPEERPAGRSKRRGKPGPRRPA
jgi:hypothetical protein